MFLVQIANNSERHLIPQRFRLENKNVVKCDLMFTNAKIIVRLVSVLAEKCNLASIVEISRNTVPEYHIIR